MGTLMRTAGVALAAVMLAPWGAACADCFDAAAKYHRVNPWVLRAIAWNESHNQPFAVHQNGNGTIDYGLMQINSTHLAELKDYGVTTRELMQACPNVYVAAWHLRRQMDRYGNTWEAIGAYHSETPRLRDQYAWGIVATLRNWRVIR
jgi:soluble lytic murein transglycosylase-like protein